MFKIMLKFSISVLTVLTLLMPAANATAPRTLETVTVFTDYRSSGITITPSARIFVSMFPIVHRNIEVSN